MRQVINVTQVKKEQGLIIMTMAVIVRENATVTFIADATFKNLYN